MSNGKTKHAVLTTALAFHYQALIGLDQCLNLKEGASIWFEKDGDVSLIGDKEESSQFEVKDFSGSLTDHHINLWKTLKNWLSEKFDHSLYEKLILHTTQPFGAKSRLSNWNCLDGEKRLCVLESIYSDRSSEELNSDKKSEVLNIQIEVMSKESSHLKDVLSRVVIFTNSEDLNGIREKIARSCAAGIPKNNKDSFLRALVGFVYESSTYQKWCISKEEFDEEIIRLTSQYARHTFTMPSFIGVKADDNMLEQHREKLFVKKIDDIDYKDVIFIAIGNWFELQNSLAEELDGAPQFRTATNRYQDELVTQYERKYARACRHVRDSKISSQDLYDDVISEPPNPMDGCSAPPLAFKNGLIHDAMDDEELNLKWEVRKK
ncbi:adenylate cyclase [Halomonas sp. KAO]|uniref:adenylate cyclase n=1 Tax=Halomonas sp. KAO TaxID=2783858 RepID=UPI00189C83AD|nr:adenylate cyclase [Halomonas sp. KAO]MBF7052435.1 adenylate cyclase [Halomonas sp. KAO]